jgi:hypothetical protein
MRRINFAAALISVFILSACFDFVGPGTPLEYADGIEYFDEALFTPIWNDLKACSKLEGSLRKVSFYYVPRVTLPPIDPGIRTLGMYFPKTNRIFVVQSEKSNPEVLRHEMLHALLRETEGHPPLYFSREGLCGGV